MGVAVESSSVRVLRAQYEAFDWLKANVDLFPIIKNGP